MVLNGGGPVDGESAFGKLKVRAVCVLHASEILAYFPPAGAEGRQ